jgi:hypothetical protein
VGLFCWARNRTPIAGGWRLGGVDMKTLVVDKAEAVQRGSWREQGQVVNISTWKIPSKHHNHVSPCGTFHSTQSIHLASVTTPESGTVPFLMEYFSMSLTSLGRIANVWL